MAKICKTHTHTHTHTQYNGRRCNLFMHRCFSL